MPTHENCLIILGDGEDALALDPDPRRVIALPARRATLMLIAALAVLATIAATWIVGRDLSAENPGADGAANDLGIFSLAVTVALWIGFAFALGGRRRRQHLVDAYVRLTHERPSPELATVTSVDYSVDEQENLGRCTLRVELSGGTRITAIRHRRQATNDAALRSLRRKTPQLPQFGDTVAVFRGADLTVVQANHSWSELRHRAASGQRAS